MQKFEKNLLGKIIIAKAEKELEPQIKSLFAILEQVNCNKLIDGFSIQVGWSKYYLHKKENGNLILITPDYSKDPFQDITEDLTLALWIQLEQIHFLRRLNVDGLSIKFNDKILLAKGVLESAEMYLQRTGDVEEGDSGWYIGSLEHECDNTTELYALYAYQLLKMKPELIRVLSLPSEFLVVIKENEIKSILNESDEEVFKGSHG